MAAVLCAVRPQESYFKLSDPGVVSLAAAHGAKYRVLIADPAQKDRIQQVYAGTAGTKPAGRPQRFHPRRTIPLLLLVAALAPCADVSIYRSAAVDQTGGLHLVLDSGKEILPPKLPGQVAFSDPAISPDRRTAGWLVMYPDPTITYYEGAQLAFKLVIYRNGRVLHAFSTEQTFWGWEFQDEGKRVAYSTGPTHGGAAECVLRDVDSGRTVARWRVRPGAEPPVWAQTLQQ